MLFKMFVDAFSACLMASKGQYVRGTPLATRLQRLCFECGALRTIFAYAHPSRCLSMMSVRPPAERCTLRRNADNWSAGFDIPGCLPSVHLCCLHARIGDLQHEVFVDPQCVLPHYVVLQTHTSFWCAKECVACNELFPQYLHAYVGIHVSWQAAASGTTVEQSREVWRDILKSIQLTRRVMRCNSILMHHLSTQLTTVCLLIGSWWPACMHVMGRITTTQSNYTPRWTILQGTENTAARATAAISGTLQRDSEGSTGDCQEVGGTIV